MKHLTVCILYVLKMQCVLSDVDLHIQRIDNGKMNKIKCDRRGARTIS